MDQAISKFFPNIRGPISFCSGNRCLVSRPLYGFLLDLIHNRHWRLLDTISLILVGIGMYGYRKFIYPLHNFRDGELMISSFSFSKVVTDMMAPLARMRVNRSVIVFLACLLVLRPWHLALLHSNRLNICLLLLADGIGPNLGVFPSFRALDVRTNHSGVWTLNRHYHNSDR